MYVGVDYYPEYWPKEMIEEDIQGIKALGANIVRIGEFSWHLMERTEGNVDFSFFDEVVKKLKENGLSIMFGTPTATFPAWLAKKHPDILSKDEYGRTRVFGGRRQYCFNSKTYRSYAANITEQLVKHYKDEEAIVAWQIDNEFGHEGSDMCYCEQCHREFQQFLREKYKQIDTLNEAYGTIFWGQTYNDFSEIPMPTKTITTHNPSLQLDWARFRSFSVNRFAHEMTNIVKKHKGSHQQVTTNVSGGFFDKWFDHEENVRYMDFVSYDNYPVWGGLDEPISPAAIAMSHDFNRGLLGKNYWIVEELMGAQGHEMIGYLPRPNQAKMWSYQAFAHGCTNMLYFSWRGMDRGAEQFCYGIVDHSNVRGRKYKEAQSVFSHIPTFEHVLHSPIQADIAVLYDYENIWSWRFQPQSKAFDFTTELLRLYEPFYRLNTNIDVIPVSRDFSTYKVLIVPVLQIIDEQLAEKLKTFARSGGTIMFSFRTGLKNKQNNIHFKHILPAHVSDLVGAHIHEVESLAYRYVPIIGEGRWQGRKAMCSVWRDLLEPTTANVLYRYDDPFYPLAAITENEYGDGDVYYIGGGIDRHVLDDLAKDIVQKHRIWHVESDEGVEVYRRVCEDGEYMFVLNHTDQERQFRDLILKPYDSQIVKI
ncbi:MAG: beta-galactosidase [Anoxybacillus mongoliensis]|nr:beta-galactosidase [Anoxybacillus mongoliensis]